MISRLFEVPPSHLGNCLAAFLCIPAPTQTSRIRLSKVFTCPSILLSEVEAFLDTYALGDEIKSFGIDMRREVAAFATIFIEVAKRSRTPADVLMNQHIGSLHKRIASIQEQLNRLPTLEGMRTEMARLANQNPALPTGVETRNFASLHCFSEMSLAFP